MVNEIPTFAYQYYPLPLPIEEDDSNIREWVEGHQDVYDAIEDDLQAAIKSKQLKHAQGDDLDRIGAMLGRFGKRNGRGDEEYRHYLRGLNSTFNGRGTVSGVKFGIGTGILANDPQEDIEITEYFGDKEYSVTIWDWQAHSVKTVYELADLSEPVGVNLRGPVNYTSDPANVTVRTTSARAGLKIKSPPEIVQCNTPNSRTTLFREDGFGSGRFDGDDAFGPGYDDATPGSFESGTLVEWDNEHPAFGLNMDFARNGDFSGYIQDTNNPNIVAERNFTSAAQINTAKVSIRETSNSTGEGLRIRDSTGTYIAGVALDNDEWDVEDANGIRQVLDPGHGYDKWIDITINFDWTNGVFEVIFDCPASGQHYEETGLPLVSNSDVMGLELWNYHGGTWGSNNIEAWFDDVLDS